MFDAIIVVNLFGIYLVWLMYIRRLVTNNIIMKIECSSSTWICAVSSFIIELIFCFPCTGFTLLTAGLESKHGPLKFKNIWC